MTGPLQIEPAGPRDAAFVSRLSGEVFARFGHYERLLPGLMPLAWVRTVVARRAGRAVGFAMYSLETLDRGEVDLVAIAVEPAAQSRGVGRALLSFVEARTLELLPEGPAAVRLTVAEDNAAARTLFERSGYVAIPGERGLYDGGQASMGLRKPLR